MTFKPRRIDLHPDQFIAGIAGKMRPEQLGVYFMICLRIYSHGGAIDDTEEDIAGLFKKCNPRTVRAIISQLEMMSKLERTGSELMANGCRSELEAAAKRMRIAHENGSTGGRPIKQNNDLTKPTGFYEKNQPAPSLSPSLSPSKIDAKASSSKDFDEWYFRYPNKVGRGQAVKAFPAAMKRAGSLQILLAGLDRYKSNKPPDRNWCNPATWLNGDRWLDEPDLMTGGMNGKTPETDSRNAQALSDELLRRNRERAQQRREGMAGDPAGDASPLLSAVSG